MVNNHLNCRSIMNGPIRNPNIVINAAMTSRLPPTSAPSSPPPSENASNNSEMVIRANATSPYSPPKVSAEENPRLGNLLTYLVAGREVSAHSRSKLVLSLIVSMDFLVSHKPEFAGSMNTPSCVSVDTCLTATIFWSLFGD